MWRERTANEATPKPLILIVDDTIVFAEAVSQLLIAEGFEAATAGDGRVGLISLASRQADLVILDVMMPVMSGPEMARAMKRDPRFASVPIIMMTAQPSCLPSDRPPLYDVAFRKPFLPAELIKQVVRLLSTAKP